MKNYYEILQVNKNASPEIVTKVYHILAKKYHPDSTASNIKEAEEKFKEISEAYEILSNEEKRKKYDIALEEEKNSSVVSIEEYNSLLDRYEELETYLNSSNSNEINSYNDEYKIAKAKIEAEAYKDAVNKAYHDSYINNLKNMGYKIKYKKTFKEKVKNFFTLIITFTIIFVILYILWHIPSVQIKIKDTFFFFKI